MFTRQGSIDLPVTKNDLSIIYTDQEVIDVSADDNIYVDLTATSPNYLVHQFKLRNSNSKDSIKITMGIKSNFSSIISPIYLQVWNTVSKEWETLDTNNLAQEDEKIYLVGRITSNQANYYDEVSDLHFPEVYDVNEITVRVYQYNNQ